MRTKWIALGFVAGIATGAVIAVVLPAMAQFQLNSTLRTGSAGLVKGEMFTIACSDANGLVSPGQEIRISLLFTAPASSTTYAFYQLTC